MSVVVRNNQYWQGKSRERSPLGSHRPSTSYGGCNPSGPPPPRYEKASGYGGGRYQGTPIRQNQRDSSLPHFVKITAGCTGVPLVFLIILAQAVAFIFFYDLPTKLDGYSKATARMREQQDAMRKEARHLESERIAFQRESGWLEKQRLALESATLKLEGEKDALESAIRRSEQERSELEQEKQLLEDERHLMEGEKEELREERGKWEKAREDRVPQNAFWAAGPMPAPDCRAYGKREYWAELLNIPEDWTDLEACMNMPTTIEGVSIRRPDRCVYVGGSHIYGFWMVDWNQVDCQPWHDEGTDMVRSGRPTWWHLHVRLGSRTLISRAARTQDPAPVVSKPGF